MDETSSERPSADAAHGSLTLSARCQYTQQERHGRDTQNRQGELYKAAGGVWL
jgi:hypothetical protein